VVISSGIGFDGGHGLEVLLHVDYELICPTPHNVHLEGLSVHTPLHARKEMVLSFSM
jgi:hypothetical protein